jgi:tetratricopeptide (TPR) repeat protein
VEYFQQAIQEDPNDALGYAGLAETYMYGVPGMRPEQQLQRARDAVRRALELNDSLGEAHVSLALLKFRYDWDFSAAELEFKRAIELNPNYPPAHHWYSHYLLVMRRFDESLAQSKRNLELDPLSPAPHLHLADHYLSARQYDLSIAQNLKTLQMDPNYIEAHRQLGHAYLGKRMYNEAIRELQKARDLSGNATDYLAMLGNAYALAGRSADARKVLDELLVRAKQADVPPEDIAAVYAGLDSKDRALEWLEKAYKERSPGFVGLGDEYIMFDNLRSDPRFHDLRRRVGLPQ